MSDNAVVERSVNRDEQPAFAWGAQAIGKIIGRNPRQTHHLLSGGKIKSAVKIGGCWCASSSRTTSRIWRAVIVNVTNGAGAAAAEPASEARDVAQAGEPVRQSTIPKWRDVLPVHPAAELFPLMSREELIALANDIKENGLQQKVALGEIFDEDPDDPDGFLRTGKYRVLDGRNRLDALEYLGEELFETIPKGARKRLFEITVKGERRGLRWDFVRYVPGVEDDFSFVISANIHRRHLTAEQRRELIAKVLKAKPEASNREIAAQVKVDHKTVASVRAEAEATGEIPQLEKTVGKDGKERPTRKSLPAAPSTQPKVGQKVFDSPQEAHSQPYELGSLPTAWAEVEAFAAAGNTHRLEGALQRLLKEVSAVLARVRS